MHIGDAHIDAYWALALPHAFRPQVSNRWGAILWWLVMVVIAYAIFATMSRATIATLLLVAVVMIVAQVLSARVLL